MNVASVPGLTNESLTKFLIDTCESRGDAAIVGIDSGFILEQNPRLQPNLVRQVAAVSQE